MNEKKSIEKAREYFSCDRFATENGITLDELDEVHSLCSVTLEQGHRNAFGGVMGGAIFTLADFAFATLTNDEKNVTVAQTVSINFLSPAKGKKLFAKATYRKNGRSTCVVNVDIFDDMQRDVAVFTGTGFKLKRD